MDVSIVEAIRFHYLNICNEIKINKTASFLGLCITRNSLDLCLKQLVWTVPACIVGPITEMLHVIFGQEISILTNIIRYKSVYKSGSIASFQWNRALGEFLPLKIWNASVKCCVLTVITDNSGRGRRTTKRPISWGHNDVPVVLNVLGD